METEQNFTEFNKRVQDLRVVTGKSQAEIAELLRISRTTLHHYCTGRGEPRAAVWFQLAQAEQQCLAELRRDQPLAGEEEASGGAGGQPQAVEEPMLFVDERPRTEIELARHLRWLQEARLRQQEAALAAQKHLHEIEGWVHDTEAELARVREAAARAAKSHPTSGREGAEKAGGAGLAAGAAGLFRPLRRKEKRGVLRDIATVSLPIFGALPAGWPQTSEGVLKQQPARTVKVARGRFPKGAFGLEVRGDSMNAAQPVPILDGDIVVLLPSKQREPRNDDIVAALIDGDTCLKRLKTPRRKGAYLKSESTNPSHGEIFPTHDLAIQGVVVGKL